jgi:polysaccharide biosynthesis/export protein
LIQLGYQINQNGFINYPGLGLFKLEGLSLEEATLSLENALISNLKGSVLKVALMNWKIAVFGEVAKPGWYTIAENKMNIYEAISMAGDFTPFAKRNEILLIRNKDQQRFTYALDIHQLNEIYYLLPNDVIYVPPIKQKWVSIPDPFQRFLTYVTAIFSITGLLAALLN